MDKFAKLIDGNLEFAPQNKDNICNYNLSEELMRTDGYKRYVEDIKDPDKKYHESYNETANEIRLVFTEFTQEEYEEYAIEQARKEREEKDKMILTPADVERALYYGLGIDFDDLKELIKIANPIIDTKGLSIEFRAKDFFRGATNKDGNRIVDMIGTLLGLDSNDLDYLFENKELSIEARRKAQAQIDYIWSIPIASGDEEYPIEENYAEQDIEELDNEEMVNDELIEPEEDEEE